MIQQQSQTEPQHEEPDTSTRSNRRGLNLSLADRARGGKNSAKQQRRDSSGRFAGAVKGGESNASKRVGSAGSAASRQRVASNANGRGRFDVTHSESVQTKEPDEEHAGAHSRAHSRDEAWAESSRRHQERILQEM